MNKILLLLLLVLIITSCNYQKRKIVTTTCVITDIEVTVASTIETSPVYKLITDCDDTIIIRRNLYKVGDTITTRSYHYQKN